jgi:hypothetical protein
VVIGQRPRGALACLVPNDLDPPILAVIAGNYVAGISSFLPVPSHIRPTALRALSYDGECAPQVALLVDVSICA